MEEQVGQIWHRLVTRAASREQVAAAVTLDEVAHGAGLCFRAFGGDPGLRVDPAPVLQHGARRRLLERIAGSGGQVSLAFTDLQALRLPSRIALFTERDLNRALYLWLSALAATEDTQPDWFRAQQQRTSAVLARMPGLRDGWHRLLQAHLAQRPDPRSLPAAEADAEEAIRAALNRPGSVAQLPSTRRPPAPVPLWLHPLPPLTASTGNATRGNGADRGAAITRDSKRRRHHAQAVQSESSRAPFMLFKADAILSWCEFTRVNRASDDDDDPDAARTAEAMDRLSIAPDGESVASRLRVDLDLVGGEDEAEPLTGEQLLPEWDFRRGLSRTDHCRVREETPPASGERELPPHLRALARRVRSRFEQFARAPAWQRRQPEGTEIDIDALLEHRADRRAGRHGVEPRLYRSLRRNERDLACLLLADLSLSTDAWVNDEARVIDVIRDSLHLLGEALAATGDRFALYGFSSRRRHDVRLQALKRFSARYDDDARARVNAIRPGFYTRLGAALRFASGRLHHEPARRRLLLVLTDGKPNDQDHYDGRYGIEDTRMAVIEARRIGLHPFCVTIDEKASDYLPHLFGSDSFVLVRNPAQLPRELTRLYARLTT